MATAQSNSNMYLSRQDIQSQLPTEARKLPGMYALCTEAVARLNMAYRDTCQQEHYVERYLQRYVAFTSEDGARRHLLSVFPAYREEADRCRKLREEVRLSVVLSTASSGGAVFLVSMDSSWIQLF